ncbi:hypothetical protein RD792_008341 [Penstemon davidsonii]|uniref:HPP transmembrane region domain-containing protein n=1 Tax=Penstemon davidsonii TaxID=160366 RepID=A0ABR0D8X9_9LAMI|nr:hypothetical protein RD792_008341 [Penstemon davidsonii]
MGMQLHPSHAHIFNKPLLPRPSLWRYSVSGKCDLNKEIKGLRRKAHYIISSSSASDVATTPFWDHDWAPDQNSKPPSLSDIVWPSAGAFAAMAILGKIDQILAPKGISMTIAPLGAVCAVLFATPSSPGARKYNIFVAQIGCAAIGVLAFAIFGPGWLARSTSVAAALAFMIFTRAVHPPAASLPLLFIDGVKFHHLNFWYTLFPGATGCILLCLIDEGQSLNRWEGYTDWRNRPALRGCHGSVTAAFFVLVVEVLENLAFLANASNLVLYLSKFMHFSPSSSANIVTNFMGTAFLLAILGGFLSDSYLTTYYIYLISATTELLGLLMLTIQAHIPSLKPPVCTSVNKNVSCEEGERGKAVMLFVGLYLVALGVGGIKGSLPPHGAEQFDEHTPHGRKQRSTFFNYYVFSLACGALIAVTFVVWIEDNKGWQWGFGIATATILLSIPVFLLGSATYRIKIPAGSPITTIFKVLTAATYKCWIARKAKNAVNNMSRIQSNTTEISENEERVKVKEEISKDLKFLNRALEATPTPTWLHCTANQVEEVKSVIKILPIFMSTIMLNCCLAQLSTFSVQQAATMNTKIGSLRISPASLPVFPVLFILILAPVYNHIINPFFMKLTNTEMGITPLQRIGTGLVLSIIAMTVAALVEMKRKSVATQSGLTDSTKPLPITFLWVALQYLFLGSADLFSLAGMMDFFFTEAPFNMRSLATSLSWASLAMGYYLSSVLVELVNCVTGTFSHTPWLYGSNLNHYHLERFYWFMSILNGLNFLHYLFWARRYNYKTSGADNQKEIQMPNVSSDV